MGNNFDNFFDTMMSSSISSTERWLQTHTYTNPIIRWKAGKWREIPANFGRK